MASRALRMVSEVRLSLRTLPSINKVNTTKIVRRRERDSNPRVQGTVDFKSTAIPGYAISAEFRARKPVIANTGRPSIRYEPYASSSSSLESMWTTAAANAKPVTAMRKVIPGSGSEESEED